MKKTISFLIFIQSSILFSQVIANIPDIQYKCDSAPIDMMEVFNLRDSEAQIIGGQENVVVSYYLTSGNALGGFGAIANPEAFVNTSNPLQIFTRVDSTTSNDNTVGTMEIEVTTSIAAAPQDLFVDEMDGDGTATFDLTVNETEMMGGNPDISFLYFEVAAECEAIVNPLANPTMYENLVNPQTVYVRAINQVSGCEVCFPFELSTDEELNNIDFILGSSTLYPVPAKNILNIHLPNLTSEIVMEVFSLQGKKLLSKWAANKNETIAISGLSPGFYFLKISTAGREHVMRFVKQ